MGGRLGGLDGVADGSGHQGGAGKLKKAPILLRRPKHGLPHF
jgi:hypothetical protein